MKGNLDEPLYSVGLLEPEMTICDVIDNHIHEHTLLEKNAFFVADLGVVITQHVRWRTHMAQSRPFYTVRCNRSPVIIEVLAALGTGFICSNKFELELVQSHGVPSDDIIYSGVCKQLSQIKHAARNGIDFLVCDNEAELRKISRCHPNAKLLLQLTAESTRQEEEMSMAFGCTLKDCRHLLEQAKELGVQVVGVRSIISDSCLDDNIYIDAITDARCVFDMGVEFGFNMKILDIGCGSIGSDAQLERLSASIASVLDLYFPPSTGVSIIAEQGCYFVSSAFTLAVNIVSKEEVALEQPHDDPPLTDEPEFQYYMNEGVYGSFAGKLAETQIIAPSALKNLAPDVPKYNSSLWGPSGDDLDQVVERCQLPELGVGDWLVFSQAGAYGFGQPLSNNSPPPAVFYVISSTAWCEMQDSGVAQETTLKNCSLVPYFMKFSYTNAARPVPV